MLSKLSVSNFAIINHLTLEFQKGLTIITGETGAGKSILLGALRLILGERADLTQINDASKKCIIEAVFDISALQLETFFNQNDVDFDEQTILRRELLPGGKSRAFINDTPVKLHLLQQLGEQLIDIHSQFNSEVLLNQSYQIQILDAYAGQFELVKNYQDTFAKRKLCIARLEKANVQLEQKNSEADYKQFLLDELYTQNVLLGELEELENEQSQIQNIDEIQRILFEIQTKFDTAEFGLLAQLNEVSSQLQKISKYGEDFEDFSTRIQSSKLELEDSLQEITSKLEKLESNPERLQEINERLDDIHSLFNKHRVNSIDELLEIQSQLENEQADFLQLETEIARLKKEISALEILLNNQASDLSKSRLSVVPVIEKELLKTVSKLGMENATLKIEARPKQDFGSNGKDEVEFLFSANRGVALRPIGKSVSGGERSRLMLAIKKIMAGKLELPTLILDEIDTGVSGKVANEVGQLMQEMAKDTQLISITHLPQVAAKADQHFKVKKEVTDEKTSTIVVELDKSQRVREIAELLSGSNITDTALNQARELIRS